MKNTAPIAQKKTTRAEHVQKTMYSIMATLTKEEVDNGQHNLVISALIGHKEGVLVYLKQGVPANHMTNGGLCVLDAAVIAGDLEIASILINNGADTHYESPYSYPLKIAINVGDIDMIDLLIKNGHAINDESKYYFKDEVTTRMEAAIRSGHIPVVEYFISLGDSIEDPSSNTAIMRATKIKKKQSVMPMVEFLLSNGMKVNSNANLDETDLIIAIRATGLSDVVKLLLENGANPNDCNRNGYPIEEAVDYADYQSCRHLLEAGADIGLTRKDFPLLSCAAEQGEAKIIHLLAQYGANLNEEGIQGTPLFIAVCRKKFKAAEALLKLGTDVNYPMKDNDHPLNVAAGNSMAMTQLLIQYGADLNNVSQFGTPLFAAVENEKPRIMDILINAGADINAADRDGRTPLMAAAERGHFECMNKLLDADANMSIVNSKGQTAMANATTNKRPDIVSILEQTMLNRASVASAFADPSDDEFKPAVKRMRL